MKKKESKSPWKGRMSRSVEGDSAGQRLSKSARDDIFKLAALTSKGAPDAAIELYMVAALAVGFVTQLSRMNREAFSEIAKEKFAWPVMLNLHPEQFGKSVALVKRLKLGRNTQISLSSGKSFSWDVPANVVAFSLHQLAQSLRRAPMSEWTSHDLQRLAACGVGLSSINSLTIHSYGTKYEEQLMALETWGQSGAGSDLPALSKTTASRWAQAARGLFLLAYGEKFEEHPYLQELRTSVFLRSKNAYGKMGARGDMRNAMRRALKQAWSSIAAVD